MSLTAMVEMFGLTADVHGWTALLAVGTVCLFLYWISRRGRDAESWDRYGVKQVSMPLVQLREGFEKLIQEHGDTVGLKRNKLWLVTRDLSILKEVLVKDFNNFTDRPFEANTCSLVRKGVFFLRGDDWRRVRHIITPSFSTSKLKHVFKTIQERSQQLTKVFEECARGGRLVPLKHIAGQFSSEIIARTAFGLNADCLGRDDDDFTYNCKQLVRFNNRNIIFLIPLFQRFPWIPKLLVKVMKLQVFDSVSLNADHYLSNVLRQSLEERHNAEHRSQKLPADLLQSFITAMNAGEQPDTHVPTTGNETSSSDDSWERKVTVKTMSEDELIGQCLIILFAAFETTSTTLQMCYYMLAKYPEVQEKVFNEIESVIQSDCPTYKELSQLTYMEKVINETIRIYPPISIASREAADTKTYGSITIPRGAAVFLPIFSILKDPKHFPDPDRFDPERFSMENSAKRDPMAFMPFGYGPRICLGKKLALLEVKTALAITLRRVRFELNDRTEPRTGEEPKMRNLGFLVPETPISLSVKLRN